MVPTRHPQPTPPTASEAEDEAEDEGRTRTRRGRGRGRSETSRVRERTMTSPPPRASHRRGGRRRRRRDRRERDGDGRGLAPSHDATATDAAASVQHRHQLCRQLCHPRFRPRRRRRTPPPRRRWRRRGPGGQRWGLARRDRGRNRSEMADEDVSGAIPGDVKTTHAAFEIPSTPPSFNTRMSAPASPDDGAAGGRRHPGRDPGRRRRRRGKREDPRGCPVAGAELDENLEPSGAGDGGDAPRGERRLAISGNGVSEVSDTRRFPARVHR